MKIDKVLESLGDNKLREIVEHVHKTLQLSTGTHCNLVIIKTLIYEAFRLERTILNKLKDNDDELKKYTEQQISEMALFQVNNYVENATDSLNRHYLNAPDLELDVDLSSLNVKSFAVQQIEVELTEEDKTKH